MENRLADFSLKNLFLFFLLFFLFILTNNLWGVRSISHRMHSERLALSPHDAAEPVTEGAIDQESTQDIKLNETEEVQDENAIERKAEEKKIDKKTDVVAEAETSLFLNDDKKEIRKDQKTTAIQKKTKCTKQYMEEKLRKFGLSNPLEDDDKQGPLLDYHFSLKFGPTESIKIEEVAKEYAIRTTAVSNTPDVKSVRTDDNFGFVLMLDLDSKEAPLLILLKDVANACKSNCTIPYLPPGVQLGFVHCWVALGFENNPKHKIEMTEQLNVIRKHPTDEKKRWNFDLGKFAELNADFLKAENSKEFSRVGWTAFEVENMGNIDTTGDKSHPPRLVEVDKPLIHLPDHPTKEQIKLAKKLAQTEGGEIDNLPESEEGGAESEEKEKDKTGKKSTGTRYGMITAYVLGGIGIASLLIGLTILMCDLNCLRRKPTDYSGPVTVA